LNVTGGVTETSLRKMLRIFAMSTGQLLLSSLIYSERTRGNIAAVLHFTNKQIWPQKATHVEQREYAVPLFLHMSTWR